MSQDRAKQLAMIYQAIEDCDREFAEERAEYKERRESLIEEARKLRTIILSGQFELLPDPPPRITEAEELQPAGD